MRYSIVPYLKIGKTVKVGLVHPADKDILDFLDQYSKTVGVQFIKSVISQSSLLFGLYCYDRAQKGDQG
jgi:hypothetical protein